MLNKSKTDALALKCTAKVRQFFELTKHFEKKIKKKCFFMVQLKIIDEKFGGLEKNVITQ